MAVYFVFILILNVDLEHKSNRIDKFVWRVSNYFMDGGLTLGTQFSKPDDQKCYKIYFL